MADVTRRETGFVESSLLLVVERSQTREGRWRFGRADEPHSEWGLIERNDSGGVEITHPQGVAAIWRDDRATALCLAATRPDEWRIVYDLSWRPVEEPIGRPMPPAIARPASKHRETLGERAARLRHQQ